MRNTTYIEEIQDPVTGERIVIEGSTLEELDELGAARFEIPDKEPWPPP